MGTRQHPIPMERGSIQERCRPCSAYIEPLLRWIHVGGRGYRFGCLQRHPTQISALAYADDLNCFDDGLRPTRQNNTFASESACP
jgi:hypothetical protein